VCCSFDKEGGGDDMENKDTNIYEKNDCIKWAVEDAMKGHSLISKAHVMSVLTHCMAAGYEAPTPVVDSNGVFDNLDEGEYDKDEITGFDENVHFEFHYMKNEEGKVYLPIFTDMEELRREKTSDLILDMSIEMILMKAITYEIVDGVVINPFGKSYVIGKEELQHLFYLYSFEVLWGDETAEVSSKLSEKVLGYLHTLAELKNADALIALGAMYYEGRGVDQDYEKAAKYYKEAADTGNSQAMSNYGYNCYYGNGVEVDYEKAYQYFAYAAVLGEYDAINKFGDFYRDGKYVEENKDLAFKIYRHGIDVIPRDAKVDAYPVNLSRLADCLMHGYGCDIDYGIARNLLREAIMVFEQQKANGRFYADSGLNRARGLMEELDKIDTEGTR